MALGYRTLIRIFLQLVKQSVGEVEGECIRQLENTSERDKWLRLYMHIVGLGSYMCIYTNTQYGPKVSRIKMTETMQVVEQNYLHNI